MFNKNMDYKKLLDDFLQFKRASGYKYRTEETILNAFYHYTTVHSDSKLGLTKKFMQTWATLQVKEGRKSLSNRVSVLREFSIYLNNFGYKVHLIKTIRNAKNKSFIPYVFSQEEIHKIFTVIDNLPQSSRNQYNSNEVYPVLFRLLYGCGLRISEALHLKIREVDTLSGELSVNIAKNDTKRVVIMSESLREVCHRYKVEYLPFKEESTTFFQHKDGSIRSICRVNAFFRNILYLCNIPYLGRGKGPYLHNLRHTFACHSFYQMYKQGIDMNVALPVLSTYLGHKSIQATERYLKLTISILPELRESISTVSSNVYKEVEFEKE